MAEEIRQLLKLHNEGKISDSALDNALKALQPDGKEPVESAVEKLRTKRREKKRRRKQRRDLAWQRQLWRMKRRKNLRRQQKPLKI